jgi:hypothetical protein
LDLKPWDIAWMQALVSFCGLILVNLWFYRRYMPAKREDMVRTTSSISTLHLRVRIWYKYWKEYRTRTEARLNPSHDTSHSVGLLRLLVVERVVCVMCKISSLSCTIGLSRELVSCILWKDLLKGKTLQGEACSEGVDTFSIDWARSELWMERWELNMFALLSVCRPTSGGRESYHTS